LEPGTAELCVRVFRVVGKTMIRWWYGRTFLYDCWFDGSSTIARQPRHRMSTSSGRLVDPRDPCRWTPRFLLGSGRAWARPQPVRWPYSGRLRFRCHVSVLLPPAIQRRHVFLFHRACCVERYILVVISLFHMSDNLPERIYIETRNGYRQLSFFKIVCVAICL